MNFYANIAATAASLIADKGVEFVFSRTTGQIINPVTGAVTAGTTAEFRTKGIFKRIRHDHLNNIGVAHGALIQQGDKMIILDNSFAPILTDAVLIGSAYWKVVGVEPVAPGGIPVIYSVQVRM